MTKRGPPTEPDDQATVRQLAVGRTVFGRYLLEGVLGRGGMGIVWRARDQELEETVALKFLPEVIARDPAAVDELRQETRRAHRLTHPHIVRIHDFVRDGATAAVSMEFVDGRTLSQLRLAQPGKVFQAEALGPIVAQLCDALDYAHQQAKVVHRDLKPANVLVTADGDVKVADFGIARSLTESSTRLTGTAGDSSGTLPYMSPQQVLGRKPTAADDIYALGATLHELLAGKPPFHRGDPYSLMKQIAEALPLSVDAHRAELEISAAPLPAAWEETVLACLAKEPLDRPPSAGAVAERLGLGPERPGRLTASREPPVIEPPKEPKKASGTQIAEEDSGADVPKRPPARPGRAARIWGAVVIGLVAIVGVVYFKLIWTQRPAPAQEAPPASEPAKEAPPALEKPAPEKPAPENAAPATPPSEPAQTPSPPQTPAQPEAGHEWTVPGFDLVLVPIPAGTFTMGSPADEPGRRDDEGPTTQVTISQPFWLGRTEVTQAQWEAVMGSSPSGFNGADRPVEQVTWDEATAFCDKLNERERAAGRLPDGWHYTLPTEARWEYACRAGTTGADGGGENPDGLAWYAANSGKETHPAAQKAANAWGLFDMQGNVWEWCQDWYEDHLPGGSVTDPTGPSSGSGHVNRGGSWNSEAQDCRPARRDFNKGDDRYSDLGFRLALTPTAP